MCKKGFKSYNLTKNPGGHTKNLNFDKFLAFQMFLSRHNIS